MRFFATAAKGTEPALRDELRELRLGRVRADRGGVHFEGQLADAARACLWSRVAVRVLLELASFEAPDATALYDGTRAVDWTAWLRPASTLAVRATCRSSRLTHSQFVAQKIKDAVVDAVRDRCGERPSVDKQDPDVSIAVHLARDRATLYLDVGGGSLHERGWRAHGGEAPLRETLAAAVVRLAGWDRRSLLVDPMCGAGTIAIEAAAWSMGIAPGLGRERFGVERWVSHDDDGRRALRAMRDEARAAARRGPAPVVARDADNRAVELTRRNARAAGVQIAVERADVRDLAPLAPTGFVVTNPPYGERLDVAPGLFEDLARACRRMHQHTVALLAGSPAIGRAMRREPDRWWILYNGAIECRLLVYGMP
ncbi:MAG TPA: THUMP domain-containing protein [Polyangiaceae bacterium]|nr:THUMP domain-containing protein [Polyangiaceae bacterium]